VQIHPDVFLKHNRHGRLRIDISANMIRGGKVDYINTKNLQDATEIPEGSGAKPLNVRFMKVSTQRIYEHSVAQVYTSPLRFFEARIGISLLLSKRTPLY
jgi:hypothetical protein